MIAHQVIHMVAMWHLGVPAIRPMRMLFRMLGTGVLGRASGGVGCGYRQNMFVNVVAVDVVQVALMQIIDVSLMLDTRVAATGTMLMAVVGMDLASSLWHGSSSSLGVRGPKSPLEDDALHLILG